VTRAARLSLPPPFGRFSFFGTACFFSHLLFLSSRKPGAAGREAPLGSFCEFFARTSLNERGRLSIDRVSR